MFPEQYTDAIGAVCRAIAQIAERKREAKDDDYFIDFDKQGTGTLKRKLKLFMGMYKCL